MKYQRRRWSVHTFESGQCDGGGRHPSQYLVADARRQKYEPGLTALLPPLWLLSFNHLVHMPCLFPSLTVVSFQCHLQMVLVCALGLWAQALPFHFVLDTIFAEGFNTRTAPDANRAWQLKISKKKKLTIFFFFFNSHNKFKNIFFLPNPEK